MYCPDFWKIALQNLATAVLIFSALIALIILNLHSFLAQNVPIKADVLVVEGWLPDYALEAARREFLQGDYSLLVTVGGPLPRGGHLSEYKTFAELSFATFIALGIDKNKLFALPDEASEKERTSNSAATLGRWLSTTHLHLDSVNLFTIGTHARRSFLVFRKLLDSQVRVGVIAAQPLNYNSKNWWKSSEGTRTVLSELIAYSYTRVFRRSIS